MKLNFCEECHLFILVKVILNVNEVFVILTMPKINIFACYQNQ